MMKHFYRFNAECISRKAFTMLCENLSSAKKEIVSSTMDPTFVNHVELVIFCSEKESDEIRNKLWELNDGAYCNKELLTKEQFEKYV